MKVNKEYHVKRIRNILINEESQTKYSNPSVLSGSLGRLIFLAAYDEQTKEKECRYKINVSIKKEIERINTIKVSNHAFNGLVGFAHGMSLLFDFDVLDDTEEELFFSELDTFMIDLSDEYIKNENFDAFYGFIGVGNVLLHRSKKNPNIKKNLAVKVDVLVSHFEKIIIKKPFIKIDFSISHGISSILSFITKYARQTNQISKYEKFIEKLCVFMLSYMDNGRVPDVIENNGENRVMAPLRWCRGDLGVSYAIGCASKLIGNEKILKKNKQIVETLCLNRNCLEQELYSASICHGTLGVAYMFLKLEKIYDSFKIIEAKKFWLEESLKIINSTKGYKFVDQYNKQVELEGILNGKEGIGLALLAFTENRSLYLDHFLQL